MLEIDSKLLLDTWSKEFCEECYKVKTKNVKDYFNEMGGKYNDFPILKDYNNLGLKQFTDIFYLPNIEVLDFFAKNKDRFRNKIVLDNGCGACFLIVFLRHIGINAIGFDNFATINENVITEILGYFGIPEVFKDVRYLQSNRIDVMIDIGSTFSEEYLLDKIEYLIFDWEERFRHFLQPKRFELEDKYSWRLQIHKKGSIS